MQAWPVATDNGLIFHTGATLPLKVVVTSGVARIWCHGGTTIEALKARASRRQVGWGMGSSVFTCIGALGTPAERGPSLESIYRVSLTVDLCEGNIDFFHHSQLGALKKKKKSGGPGHVPSVSIG